MPSSQHIAKLLEGARAWNAWRRENPAVAPDLNDVDVPVGHRQFGSVQGGPIDLSRAELCRAALEHATLIDAGLAGAALVAADLSYARLTGADLRGANLSNARLDHADLANARLESAVLRGTHLLHARNLTQEQINQACGDARTTLPPQLAMPTAWRKTANTAPSRVAKQTAPKRDANADPFAILGVAYGTSIQDVRIAYLRLVKELHPDGRFDDPVAAERLKAINKAYDDLKALQKRAAATTAENRSRRRPGALFAIGFLTASMILAMAGGGFYYLTVLGPERPRPIAAETERAEPAQPARAADELITGSISEHPKAASAVPEPETPATAQPDAANLARLLEAEDDATWAEAEREGTSAALHRYLGRYPAGRHARKATDELASIVKFEIALDTAYDRDAPAAEAAKQALRRYLTVYPNGRFAAEARGKLAAIDAAEAALQADTAAWIEAERTATSAALRAYLDAYPNGTGASQARHAIAMIEAADARQRDDRRAWTVVEQTGTREALRAYLDVHPQGKHAATARHALTIIDTEEARQRADLIAWAEAQREGTGQALQRYLDAFPDGNNVAAARQGLLSLAATAEAAAETARHQDDTAWSNARRRNTKAAYTAYLSANPEGRHAKSARSSIAELESAASKTAPAAAVQAGKPGRQTLRTGTADAPASQGWPSADEPFIGVDGRLRQK